MKAVIAIVLLMVACASAADCDCDCRLKNCKEHAAKHHEKIKCDEGYAMCKECPVKVCDGEMEKCFASATTHEQKDACMKAWYKCARCECRDKACIKHAEKYHEKNRCSLSLDICRECDTSECDAASEICHARAKTHEDLHKCINAWHKCGQCMCRFKECMKSSDPDMCRRGLVLCKNCDTEACDATLSKCMEGAKTHAALHVCLDGWYACVQKDCKVTPKPTLY